MLKRNFDMNELNLADVNLGMRIIRTFDGNVLTQSHSVEKVLNRFNAIDSVSTKTPIELNIHLSKNQGEPIAQEDYVRFIGCIMYLTNCSRPNIACVVNKLSRYTSNPRRE